MTIPPRGYLLENSLGFTCLLAVSTSGSDSSVYVLGDTFMRNFYTTFDYKADTVSFAVSSNAPAGVMIERKFTGWVIFSIVFGCILGVLLLALIGYCMFRKYRLHRASGE